MKVAIVTSEAVPFSKTGGLADVAGTLFKEYTNMGIDALLFVPLYKKTKEQFADDIQYTGIEIDIHIGKAFRKCRVFTLDSVSVYRRIGVSERKSHTDTPTRRHPGTIFFIGNDEFFDRDDLYGTPYGDYPDNDQRFIFFCRGVLEVCKRLDIRPDIMHCNDWQTGLIPIYLKTVYRHSPVFAGTKSVITIHNLGYQGIFPAQTMEITGLGWELFNMEGVEFYGDINFLKAGIVGADFITTVSKTYAKEILTPESGFGLDGILRKRTANLVGILNGIDYKEWNPADDKFLPYVYNKLKLSGKLQCKAELMKKCSFRGDIDTPLLSFIGRIASQKGIDILTDAIPQMIASEVNIVIIGRGEAHYLTLLASMKNRFPDAFFLHSEFDEAVAHLAYAGADIFLMPSLYEPCGLGQMIAMRYGTIPVARKTGGLSDTIEDRLSGFLFDEYSAGAFMEGIHRALSRYADKKLWQRMVKNTMNKDFSWRKSAAMYLDLYSGKKI
ncbi:MAG: glycogen synthase [Nitrospirae bacterium]|nr:glycogen synthase [Nitrospirota bacterium]MCL5977618.1 glycogen synthase [Nitrospirota bacterium]